jgi:hypothetical protein
MEGATPGYDEWPISDRRQARLIDELRAEVDRLITPPNPGWRSWSGGR